jgi:ankyrin repeat protein
MKMNINVLDADKNTPLHIACEFGSIAICMLLVEHGADLEIQNRLNRTPFVVSIFYGHSKICKYLKEKGAKTYYKDIYFSIEG